jgi:flagellar FliL protein
MNSKIKIAAALLAVAVFMAAAGAAAAWFGLRARPGALATAAAAASATAAASAPQAAPPAPPAPMDTRVQKYVTLEKVIVMLRHEPGDAMTHYLALDLVFRTTEDAERTTRDHLPLLRSVAVKTLAALSVEQAGTMTIDQYAAEINRAFTDAYAQEHREKPFSEAMVGKLIVE